MLRDRARVDDGIDTCQSHAAGAFHAPEGMGTADEARGKGDS